MGVNGVNVLNSELFFESVPDGFVDVPLKDWKYTPGTQEVPIILRVPILICITSVSPESFAP